VFAAVAPDAENLKVTDMDQAHNMLSLVLRKFTTCSSLAPSIPWRDQCWYVLHAIRSVADLLVRVSSGCFSRPLKDGAWNWIIISSSMGLSIHMKFITKLANLLLCLLAFCLFSVMSFIAKDHREQMMSDRFFETLTSQMTSVHAEALDAQLHLVGRLASLMVCFTIFLVLIVSHVSIAGIEQYGASRSRDVSCCSRSRCCEPHCHNCLAVAGWLAPPSIGACSS
jgi:hypothetical protein